MIVKFVIDLFLPRLRKTLLTSFGRHVALSLSLGSLNRAYAETSLHFGFPNSISSLKIFPALSDFCGLPQKSSRGRNFRGVKTSIKPDFICNITQLIFSFMRKSIATDHYRSPLISFAEINSMLASFGSVART